jgi:hypothetical protein
MQDGKRPVAITCRQAGVFDSISPLPIPGE